MIFNIGDIVDSVWWQGRGYDGEGIIRSGPYRIIGRTLVEPEPHFLDQINHVKDPYLPPPNYCFTCVPAHIPVGQEKKKDRCWLNHYLPSLHPNIMRDAYSAGDYLIKRGTAGGAQTTLF